MSLALHVFAETLFRLATGALASLMAKMQRRGPGALQIQGFSGRSRIVLSCADSRRPGRRRRPRPLRVPHPQSGRPRRARSPPLATWKVSSGSTQLAARPATMQDLASEYSTGSSAECREGVTTTVKTSVVPSRFTVDSAGSLDPTCFKCDIRVSVAEHLHNLSSYSLHRSIRRGLASYSIS